VNLSRHGQDIAHLRQKLLDHLDEQRALSVADINQQDYVTEPETGHRVLKTVPKVPRRWFWRDLEGNWFIELCYGNRRLSIDGRHTAVKAGALGNLPGVIDTLKQAVSNGELDNVLIATRWNRGNKADNR
jgi:hypothetical protein